MGSIPAGSGPPPTQHGSLRVYGSEQLLPQVAGKEGISVEMPESPEGSVSCFDFSESGALNHLRRELGNSQAFGVLGGTLGHSTREEKLHCD